VFKGFLLPSTRVKNSPAIVLLLLANSVSGIAQGISMIAIPWYFSSGGMSAQFSWIYFSVTLISLFWGIYAGALVDRHSRRKLFLAINLAGLLLIGGITGWGFWANELPWFLVGLAFATTALIYNIHFPNLYAFAQEVTEPSDYGRVTSLLEVQGQITFALAGGFSALLLEGVQAGKGLMVYLPLPSHWAMRPWTIWEIFALDASTYLIALMLISRIRSLPSHSGKSDTAALSERIKLGFRFLKNHPVVLQFGLLSQTVFLSILINSLQLMPLYIFRFMGKGAEVYALSDMVFSLGALLAGMLAAQRFRISSVTLSIPLYTAAAGLCYLALLIKLPL
jgi:MFS family permease